MEPTPKKILIIEDDPDTRRLLIDYLEEHDFEYEWVENAPEGLKKALKSPPDLILLDLMLPKMSGFGFLREWHRKDPDKKVPVVVLTALGNPEISQESMDLGAACYLTKATMGAELIPTIQEYLG